MSERSNEMESKVFSAVKEAFGDDKDIMVTKFILVAEMIGPEGNRGITYMRSQSTALWDAVGLLDVTSAEIKHVYSNSPWNEVE